MRIGSLQNLGRGHMIFVLLLMAQFQLWDGIMTQVFVNNGLVTEANGLMAPFIASGDFLPLKLMGLAALLSLLWIVFKRFPKIAMSTASCVALFYFSIVIWNFTVLFSNVL